MFSVKGWSVSAANIKAEAEASPAVSDAPRKAKKRKRSRVTQPEVTNENIADLWERVIENKGQLLPEKKNATLHKQASSKPGKPQPGAVVESTSKSKHNHKDCKDEEWSGFDDHPKAKKPKKNSKPSGDQAMDASLPAEQVTRPKEDKDVDANQKGSRDRKSGAKASKSKKEKSKDDSAGKPITTGAEDAKPPAAPKPAAKLTPLQASMRDKLISARFRHLNETLYTRPSVEAFQLFEESPEMFTEYHEGFRRQVDVWPENPVDAYVAEIKTRGRVKPSRHHHHHQDPRRRRPGHESGARPGPDGPAPLPRTDGTCTVADLGCGDAGLATALQPLRQKLRLDLRSFDLQSPSPLVVRADMANLPLPDGAVDVAVFCLALMGTNWLDFVEEAYRVLRWRGELWVSEIKSRFASPDTGKGHKSRGTVVEHSVGNRRKDAAAAVSNAKKVKAAASAAEESAMEEQLAVEVDGVETKRQETDVSAFVGALRRRGFVLRGEPAESIDQTNKMFVKMYFVKAATPTVGKGVAAAPQQRGAPKPPRKKFISADEDEISPAKESAILKPCVYKLR